MKRTKHIKEGKRLSKNAQVLVAMTTAGVYWIQSKKSIRNHWKNAYGYINHFCLTISGTFLHLCTTWKGFVSVSGVPRKAALLMHSHHSTCPLPQHDLLNTQVIYYSGKKCNQLPGSMSLKYWLPSIVLWTKQFSGLYIEVTYVCVAVSSPNIGYAWLVKKIQGGKRLSQADTLPTLSQISFLSSLGESTVFHS